MNNAALKARPELTGYFPGRRRFSNVDQRHIHGDYTSKSFQECNSPTTVPGQRQRLHPVVSDCRLMAVQRQSDRGGEIFVGNYIKKIYISTSYHRMDCCCKVPCSALGFEHTNPVALLAVAIKQGGLLRLQEGQTGKKRR